MRPETRHGAVDTYRPLPPLPFHISGRQLLASVSQNRPKDALSQAVSATLRRSRKAPFFSKPVLCRFRPPEKGQPHTQGSLTSVLCTARYPQWKNEIGNNKQHTEISKKITAQHLKLRILDISLTNDHDALFTILRQMTAGLGCRV